VTGFVTRNGDAFAIYHAQCHGHGKSEVWLDLVLGSWDEPEFSTNATFSCRVGLDGAALVDACGVVEGRAAYFGQKLRREEALADRRLDSVWELLDFVVSNDPTISSYLYGATDQ